MAQDKNHSWYLSCFFCFSVRPFVDEEIDLAFAISAAASDAENVFTTMKETISSIVDEYGTTDIHHAVIIYGDRAAVRVNFGDRYSSNEQLKADIINLRRPSGEPDLDEALKLAKQVFESEGARESARKILVVLADKRSASSLEEVTSRSRELEDLDVRVIPVAVGRNADIDELNEITPNVSDVIPASRSDGPKEIGKKIISKVLEGMEVKQMISFFIILDSSNLLLVRNVIRLKSSQRECHCYRSLSETYVFNFQVDS